MYQGDMEHIVSMFNNGSKSTVFKPSTNNTSKASPEKDPNNLPS